MSIRPQRAENVQFFPPLWPLAVLLLHSLWARSHFPVPGWAPVVKSSHCDSECL